MKERPVHTRGFVPIKITAGIAVCALGVVIGWKVYGAQRSHDAALAAYNVIESTSSTPTATTPDDALDQLLNAYEIAPEDLPMASAVSTYIAAAQNGGNTTTAAVALTAHIASSSASALSYTTYTARDVPTDDDTSYARMLTYRSDLQASLKPLLDNTQSEMDLYAQFVSTHDTMYLTQLSHAADNYRDAIALTRKVRTPKDAVTYQVGILNAMSRFTASLDTLAREAQDPFTSTGALRAFNDSEAAMYAAYNALASYYVHHTQ